jgi:hypothetical protein
MGFPNLDPSICPLCGKPNDCAQADGRTRCWCFEVQIPAEVLARVPAPLRGVACVCRCCATGQLTVQERLELMHKILRGM